MNKTALAIVAHPDDIEFRIAGTLLLLKQAGWETHYMTIASGSLGSTRYSAAQTRRVRQAEAKAAARVLGARWHASLVDDLEILYELKTLRRLSAVVREVRPALVLTHPPVDYMEDHTSACRLAVTAAFARGMPNLRTSPARKAYEGDVTVYHCTPHGLRDPLGQAVAPAFYVNIDSVMDVKKAALAAHRSQFQWLEDSQSMASPIQQMEAEALTLGRMSRKFKYAEGWWRHLHLGFCDEKADPLRDALGRNWISKPRRSS